MDIFIRKLHFDFESNQKILQLIGLIDGYKGKWSSAINKEYRYQLYPKYHHPTHQTFPFYTPNIMIHYHQNYGHENPKTRIDKTYRRTAFQHYDF